MVANQTTWRIRVASAPSSRATTAAAVSTSTSTLVGRTRRALRSTSQPAASPPRARIYPDRFGFYASLVLPDLDGSLAEAAYAFDVLKADGIVLHCAMNNIYLGDPIWDPLMEELNRRKAVIFVHPSELSGPPAKGIPPFSADFLLDTTRAAISMAKAGLLEHFPT